MVYSKSSLDSRHEDGLARKADDTQMNPKNKYVSGESVSLQIWSLCLTITDSLVISKEKQSSKQ